MPPDFDLEEIELVWKLIATIACVLPSVAGAQMNGPHTAGPLGIPENRTGSGTSWLPDASPMHAGHTMLGDWSVMLHGSGALQYDWQGGRRGSSQLGLVNWAMAMATRSVAAGQLQLRGMLSAEPWTIGSRGYPLLLQTGESYQGAPLHDRQHPHDLFMELAALYDRPLAANLAASLYLAPVGEPAVGPVAYPHRPSAAGDPLAPLSHHWQDGTHITFGVLTAGVFTRAMKLEASWFNGREPDEHRANFDYAGRRLDSYSARLAINPARRWSLAAWYAHLESPEAFEPDESVRRFGASALTTQAFGRRGSWSSALIWGANQHQGGSPRSSVVLESTLDLDSRNALFARLERVRKTAAELVIGSVAPETAYDIHAITLGYTRTAVTVRGVQMAAGFRTGLSLVPAALAAAYGGRWPRGLAVFFRLRPTQPARAGGPDQPHHERH